MALNKSKGNMYEFCTHTWNPIKGRCSHNCHYCYMKKWGEQKEMRLDEREFKTDLGSGNTIFVGSSCDMFANDVPGEWIIQVLNYCDKYDNKYIFQTKNPMRIYNEDWYAHPVFKKSIIGTTMESSYRHPQMGDSPTLTNRPIAMKNLHNEGIVTFVTIEPIMDFNLFNLVYLIRISGASFVNIGADSGNHGLVEPIKYKILSLIEELEKFTVVNQKKNLKRLLK